MFMVLILKHKNDDSCNGVEGKEAITINNRYWEK